MVCTIVTGDGRRVQVSRNLLTGSSSIAKKILECPQPEYAEINVPEIDGDTAETLVRVMAGEIAVDLMAPCNSKLLAGARTLGLVPGQTLSIANMLSQVRYVGMNLISLIV